MYEKAPNGSILSMVADCYDYKNAVLQYLVPLAKRAMRDNSNKIIVARPDSGDPIEMVIWTVKTAIKNGLCTEKDSWYTPTTLKFIEGDSMTFDLMDRIYDALFDLRCKPWEWGIFGVGGFLRNSITRDILSTKYALCSVGESSRPVIKFSNTDGKGTLPHVILSRSKESLESGITIKHAFETKMSML